MNKKKFSDLSLRGKSALVTGATGVLGRVFCEALASQGAHVAVVDLESKRVSLFAKELAKTYGVETLGIACDITREAAVEKMAKQAWRTFGRIDILHNNAATKTKRLDAFFAPFEKYSADTWKQVLDVNLNGMFLVAKAVGRRMASDKKGGSIIQTASIYGVLAPDPRIYDGSFYLGKTINTPAAYSASKGGVIALTRHLAAYWAPKGIRVNTLTPGGVQSGQNNAFVKKYSARVPMGRMGKPEEMTGALLFLASDASSYITGQNIIVDGGLSAW